jgi:hypothetical protein
LDLSLESIVLPAASVHLLARLVSSACCPRLQKLQLSRICLYELDELLLVVSTTLLELSFEGIHGSGVALELTTENSYPPGSPYRGLYITSSRYATPSWNTNLCVSILTVNWHAWGASRFACLHIDLMVATTSRQQC